MKIITFLFCFIYFPMLVNAQAFSGGIVAGLGGNQIDGDQQAGYNKIGFLAGVYVETNKDDASALRIETYYIGKGAIKNTKFADGTSVEEFKVVLNYIEIPVLYRHRFSEKFSASGGLAPAVLISSKTYDYKSLTIKDINSFDVGIIVQTDLYLIKKLPFTLRLSHSILPISPDRPSWYNSSLTFGVRYTVK